MNEIDYSKPWYRIESEGGEIAAANGDISDWIRSTRDYKLAEKLLGDVSVQAAQDIRNLRNCVLELRQEKQLALMQFCDEILTVFSEFGHATPEKKYDSPSLVISDLRSIFQLHQIDAEQIAQLERVNETLRERLRFYEQSETPF